MTKFDKFEYINKALINGATSQAKKDIKALSRSDRYDFIMWMRGNEGDYYKSSDMIMRWCVKGELK